MGSEEKKRVEDMSLEKLKAELARIEGKSVEEVNEELDKEYEKDITEILREFRREIEAREARKYRYVTSLQYPRIASTEKVVCAKMGEIHNAILLIYEDGTIKVKCSGECCDCEYGEIEF